MTFDATKGYAGSSPGQSMEMLFARLTLRDLEGIVGPRILPLLPPTSNNDKTALIAASARIFQDRGRQLLKDDAIRKTVLRNLDDGKLEELKFRLANAGFDTGSGLIELADRKAWDVAAGFFGIDASELSGAAVALQRQDAEPTFPLFAHQRSVVSRAYSKLGSGFGRTVIHMPTGAGKTRTAMHLVARCLNENEPGVIVWLAASKELLEQAAETFETAWASLGNRTVTLQRFWGGRASTPDDLTDGLLIAGLAKVHAWRQRDGGGYLRFASRVRLVIMDEAHQAIAPSYREVIEGLCGAGGKGALLGLTATPGRSWNDVTADELLSEFFNGSKVVLEVGDDPNPVKYLLDHGYLARPTFQQIKYAPAIQPTPQERKRLAALDDFPDASLDKLAADTARNLAIIEAVKALLARGHTRVILFAASVEHARDLASGIVAHGIQSGVVTGDMPSARRASILRTFKGPGSKPQVLCNYGVLTTGFDAPRTSAAIIARPTKSLVLYSQMVGRATRGPKAGGNERCEILTVHDPAYPGFGDIAEAFFNWEDVWHAD